MGKEGERRFGHRGWIIRIKPSGLGLGLLLLCGWVMGGLYATPSGWLYPGSLDATFREGPFILQGAWFLFLLLCTSFGIFLLGGLTFPGALASFSSVQNLEEGKECHRKTRHLRFPKLAALVLRRDCFLEHPNGETLVVISYDFKTKAVFTAQRRCVLEGAWLYSTWQDPLKLWEGNLCHPISGKLRVTPQSVTHLPECLSRVLLGTGEEMVEEGNTEGDLLEMREYRLGDPARLILWKLFARTGKYYVRMPEIVGGERFGVFFCSGRQDQASAALAFQFMQNRSGLNSNWLFDCPGNGESPPVEGGSMEAQTYLLRSGNLARLPGEDERAVLKRFLLQMARERIGNLVLFLPADAESLAAWEKLVTESSIPVVGILGYRPACPPHRTDPKPAYFAYQQIEVPS